MCGKLLPVQVVDVLGMGSVIFDQFTDQPGHEGRWNPFASVDTFYANFLIISGVRFIYLFIFSS